MKKITLLGLFLFISQLFFGQTVTIPDANFKASLVNNSSINTNGDTEIQVDEAEAYSGSLYYYGNSTITDVTGIEAFISVISINFTGTGNSVLAGSMNLSNFTALTSLKIGNTLLGNVNVSGCTALETLSCAQSTINSLNITGCTALEELNCGNNNLASLDVSTNIQLTSLSCYNNDLTSLIMSNITQLTSLSCGSNNLVSLDISDSTQLNSLHCSQNNLTSLDVSNNTQLTNLWCFNNDLTSLNLSNNTQLNSLNLNNNDVTNLNLNNNTLLTYLDSSHNPLNNLDVSNNTLLTQLSCVSNRLSTLDVSANTQLAKLWCHLNQLTELDVNDNTLLTDLNCRKNDLNYLYVQNGNNNNFTNFIATQNSRLICIFVDNPSYSTTNWTSIDTNSIFVETQAECESQTPTTYVPDDNFEQALIDLGYDDILDDYVITAYVNTVHSLNVDSKNIVDLTGIEDFVQLSYLHCSNNELSSFDISNNTRLTHLYCNDNLLTNLDISNNTQLTHLYCNDNSLTNLDVSNNTQLTHLYCNDNPLTNLDVNNNTQLTHLDCHNNTLTNLDINNNTQLTHLYCQSNTLTNLDVTNNIQLTNLNCYYTQLTNLDISNNTQLIDLNCLGNQLTTLDVSHNTLLTSLDCFNNQLTTLDVSNNTQLFNLHCVNNNLTSLDLTNNTQLIYVTCHSNQLTSIDLRNGNNTIITSFSANNNPDLTCIFVDDATYSTTNWGTSYSFVETQAECDIVNDDEAPIPNLTNLPDITDECEVALLTPPTATDNLSGTITATTTTTLPITTQGTTMLTWIYDDGNGNTSTQTQNIILNDVTAPVVITQNITVDLAGVSSVSITPSQIDNDSTDNCTINTMTLDIDTFTEIGEYTVILTIEDTNTNSSSDTAIVTVIDSLATTYVPDDNFEQALIDLGYDDILDDYVFTSNINTVAYLNLDNKNITDLTGIEDFTELLYLWCNVNGITSLDLSQNTNLVSLKCNQNQLASLNVSNSDSLTTLECYLNQLTSLDVTNNTTLTNLSCSSNQLSSLDISQNILLTSLSCSGNQLSTLDVTQNTALIYLGCAFNQLTSLIVTQNTDLSTLDCASNQLTLLDVSSNTLLDELECRSNQLIELDVSQNTVLTELYCNSNDLISLDLRNGNNTNMSSNYSFYATYNPNLTCIYVDDAAWSNTNWTHIDSASIFVETEAECNLLDDVAPVADITTLSDVISECEVTVLTPPTATDNLSGTIIGTTDVSLPIISQGTTVITWTYLDGNGNTSTQTQNVIIEDVTPPVIITQNITIDLAGNSSINIIPSQIDNGSTDNCTIDTMTLDIDTFTTTGDHTVSLIVEDTNGNSNSENATVTVIDTTASIYSLKKVSFIVYPNPTNSIINIDSNFSISKITIYNEFGQLLLSNRNKNNMDISKLAQGVYFVKIEDEQKNSEVQKIIKE